jgi:hypothetical protein
LTLYSLVGVFIWHAGRLQLKVSKIREAFLRNSLSHSGTLHEFFGGPIAVHP